MRVEYDDNDMQSFQFTGLATAKLTAIQQLARQEMWILLYERIR